MSPVVAVRWLDGGIVALDGVYFFYKKSSTEAQAPDNNEEGHNADGDDNTY